MTREDISRRVNELREIRKKKVLEIGRQHDDQYLPEIQELRRLCGQTDEGHKMEFSSFGFVSGIHYTCSFCQYTEFTDDGV